jgi:hypothetical protein
MPKEYVIEGARVVSLETFYDEISAALVPGVRWGRNLDAFEDILGGGFGTPDAGFVLRWRDSALSKQKLGYTETARQLRLRLEGCHPSNRADVQRELREAEAGRGTTVFDWLIEILRSNGPDGDRPLNNVVLVLD